MTIEEIRARRGEIRTRLQELDNEHAGEALPDDARSEWNELNEEEERLQGLQGELEARAERVGELGEEPARRQEGATFQTSRPGATRGDDIWDLTTIRSSVANPEEATREMRDRASRAIEAAHFPHERARREDAQERLERLIETRETERGELSRHLLTTGSPEYRRAFSRAVAGRPLSNEEQRALSVGTDNKGGFAVPFQLDPTIIPTSNGSVNPYRAISRVETLVGSNEWKGVTSAGVTAGYGDEASEVDDDSPTIGQPSVTVQRADAFVPFSIEVEQDWSGLQSEVAMAIQDAKDDLEADKFTVGTGVDPEPEGLLVGATTTVETASAETFAVGDVYGIEEALPPRFRPRAQWVANRAIYNRVRRFDTQGGAALWIDNLQRGLANEVPTPGNTGARLLGYPANEVSTMDSTIVAGDLVAVLGDFRYFLIAERLGMTVELVSHLFGANRRPTGQRGFLAIWRNNTAVLSPNAFRVLEVAAAS